MLKIRNGQLTVYLQDHVLKKKTWNIYLSISDDSSGLKCKWELKWKCCRPDPVQCTIELLVVDMGWDWVLPACLETKENC